MGLKEPKWHTTLFLIFLLLFLSLSLYEIYRFSVSTGTLYDEDDVLIKRRDEFYKGIERSGIEPYPARYWEVYKEDSRVDGE